MFAAQGMRERPVSVLASADSSGIVVLSICGAYRLITIDLKAHRRGDSMREGKSPIAGSRFPTQVADGSSKGRSRKVQPSPGPEVKAGTGTASEAADGDVSGDALRPLQLALSADLSLLSALVEVDGHVELIQVCRVRLRDKK